MFVVLKERSAAYEEGELDWFPRWHRREGDSFMLGPRKIPAEEACLSQELLAGPPELPQTARLNEALVRDSRVSPFIDQLVGSPVHGMRVEIVPLRQRLLWRVFRAGNDSLTFTDDSFERGYAEWLSDLLAREKEVRVLAPLHPMNLSGRIDLGNGLEIGQLDDDEVSACLNMGALRSPFASTGLVHVRNRAAVRFVYTLPRGLYDFSDDEKKAAHQAGTDAMNLVREVVGALRVFKVGRVAIAGEVLMHRDGSMQGGPVGPTRLSGPEMNLSEKEQESLFAFWQRFKRAQQSTALAAVVRRFSYAGERTRHDDEIVDLVAALEALLLSEIEERGELRFRTALRGAVFIDAAGLTRRQIQRQLRRAYDVRSAVAHGGTPSEENLKSPSGDRVSLDVFVTGVEELVRVAVRKAIDAVGDGAQWPPDWDALIFEQAEYP